MSKYKQCHSCGGNCGGTKKTGCQYRAPKVRSYDQLMSDYREVVRQRDTLTNFTVRCLLSEAHMKTTHIGEPGQWWLKDIEALREAADEIDHSTGMLSPNADKLRAIADHMENQEPVAYLDVEGLPEKGMKYATQFRVNDRQSALFDHPPSEPDGEVVVAVDSPNDAAVIRWVSDYRPKVGDKIYALRAAKEGK